MVRVRRTGSAAVAVIVIVAVVAIAGAAVWYFMLRSTPEKTVAQMMEAQIRGDNETVKNCVTERSQHYLTMPGAMTRGITDGEDEDIEYTVGEAEIDGDRAKVPVTVPVAERVAQISGMKDMTFTYALRREDGRWKVDFEDTLMELMGNARRGLLEMMPRAGPGNER